MALADIRREYVLHGLLESEAAADPLVQFHRWFDQALAANVVEPNAMILATATPDGHPSARVVLLKICDDRGFTFFTNCLSRKGRELAANPRASLVFFWAELERQVRVEGNVAPVTVAESDEYFASRPADSRLGAVVSPQSQVISDRSLLERELARLKELHPDGAVSRPDHWGGYRVQPVVIEFWQGRPARLHDRLQYHRMADGSWTCNRLAP